jgi:hypothetical protein
MRAPAGAFGFPVSHGSKTIRFPPGVVTTNVEWPYQVMERADIPLV